MSQPASVVARGDGDGWVRCAQGHRHWGRFGAAGLLLRHRPADGGRLVLLQHRAVWSHHGGTWGLPGGARDSHETAVQAALREAAEEIGLDATVVRVQVVSPDDHGGWRYDTVVAGCDRLLDLRPANGESLELRWVAEAAVPGLPLHPGFAASWPRLTALPS